MNSPPIQPQQARLAGVCYLVTIHFSVGSEVALRGPQGRSLTPKFCPLPFQLAN